jgi:hypothetical protein
MQINTAEHVQDSIVESFWKEKGQQEGMKIHARRSILMIIEQVKGSKLSDEFRKQMEGIHELETLDAILDEIWNVKDIDMIGATINKYDWLEEMNRLDEEI